MQKLLIVLLLSVSVSSFAQTGVKKPAVAKKPATAVAKPAGPVMKNQSDSFSYAIGVSIANFYKEQGITGISSQLVTKAINDCNAGKPAITDGEVNNIIMNFMQQKRSEKSASVRKVSDAFMAENKNKPGVITTASGLQYVVLKEGDGPKPTLTDRVKVHYHGTLLDGTIFDSSVQRGEPYTLNVTQVVQGWIEALQLMPVGSKWRLYVPPALGYGDNDNGPIKGGSVMVFELELLEIVK